MATNNALITSALKLLGVIGESETPSAEQGAEGLTQLNRMMEAWDEDGKKLGWFEQTLTTAEAPLPKWAERGVVSKLAQALQGLYPASSLAPWVFDDAQNGYDTILRRTVIDQLKPADMSHMAQGSGKFGPGDVGYEIISDSSDGFVWQ